jgi:DNA polymerase-3 subunit alpha
VKQLRGEHIDLDRIPLDDMATFHMLARGETMGLFQLNGSGMTAYLKQLRPTTIHDINAMVALYRPGPMEMIPEYIKRKHNNSLVRYLDPRMKDILDQSFGVITYQDDVMMIAIKLAGYSWLEADKLRKAMGKKIPAEMEAQKEKLLKGFVENGMTPKKAQELWELIEPFAAYGFNKAHAASYGRVSYQTAFMKANYPVEYMTAILTAESGDVEKVAEIIHECEKMKIEVLPPDVNASFGGFTVIENKPKDGKTGVIRFGFYTIKNMGTDIADAIIAERKAGGTFKNIGDFLDRIKHKNLNKKSMEALIKSGAMDAFGERGQLLGNLEDMLEYNKEVNKVSNQVSLFGDMPELLGVGYTLKPAEPAAQKDMLQWEKELLGLYVSGHPLNAFREKIEKNGITIKKIKEELNRDMPITFAGIIEEVKVVITKNNDRMAFMRVADFTGAVETVVFPKVFKEYGDKLVMDSIVAIKGKVSERKEERSVLVDAVKLL